MSSTWLFFWGGGQDRALTLSPNPLGWGRFWGWWSILIIVEHHCGASSSLWSIIIAMEHHPGGKGGKDVAWGLLGTGD